jgi:methylmalonyl-CoA/ethylmalonyl-CoA epimerase
VAGLAGLITKVDHVGIAVEDLDVAIEFYKSVFGFELQHREENVEQGVVEAMMAIGGSQTQIQ